MKATPLAERADAELALGADLEFGARAYAALAAYHGKDGEAWGVWLALQRARSLDLPAAIAELAPNVCHWFAGWCFERGLVDEGLVAYRAYLRSPGEYGPFGTCGFLDALLARGEYAEVIATADALAKRQGDEPDPTMRVCRALAATGKTDAALERLAAVRHRYDDRGDLWALTALLENGRGDRVGAERALRVAVKLHLGEEIALELTAALGLAPNAIAERHAPYEPPDTGYEEDQRLWPASPGARIRPSTEPSPHCFGGQSLAMPACHGCGHPIRAYFVLDVRAEPRLAAVLPGCPWFALMGCHDCLMWMGRHDYELLVDERAVRLVAVGLSRELYGEANDDGTELPHVPVRLDWLAPRSVADDEEVDDADIGEEEPQVLGAPRWTQSPERPICRRCKEVMMFVAAMASTKDIGDYVAINNESGFQYHFACNGCRTVSVIAQWT